MASQSCTGRKMLLLVELTAECWDGQRGSEAQKPFHAGWRYRWVNVFTFAVVFILVNVSHQINLLPESIFQLALFPSNWQMVWVWHRFISWAPAGCCMPACFCFIVKSELSAIFCYRLTSSWQAFLSELIWVSARGSCCLPLQSPVVALQENKRSQSFLHRNLLLSHFQGGVLFVAAASYLKMMNWADVCSLLNLCLQGFLCSLRVKYTILW